LQAATTSAVTACVFPPEHGGKMACSGKFARAILHDFVTRDGFRGRGVRAGNKFRDQIVTCFFSTDLIAERLMKTLLAVFLLMAGSAFAEIKFPPQSFTIDELAEAQKAAGAKGRPIAFVYTNKNTTCGLCAGATEVIIGNLKASAILVYLENKGSAPQQVAAALEERGRFIPKVVVFDAGLSTNLGLVTYEEIKAEGERPLRKLKSDMRKAKG
jgi:hypothetical protein